LSVRKLVYRLAALPAVAATAVVSGCGAAGERVIEAAGNLTLEQARAFAEFPLVYAGERVDGLPLVAILRRDDTADYVSFVYGDCRPTSSEGGCAPPAEIQVWPALRRSLASYGTSPGAVEPEMTRIRGSPAALFDAGTRLELYTAEVTVVVFARSRERASSIAAALRCLTDGADAPSDNLAC
jgi:hypothetical protein